MLEGLGGYTDSLMESVNAQVAVAFDRQRALEAEIKALQKETGDFVKRSAKWVALVASFNESLKCVRSCLFFFTPEFASHSRGAALPT